jgi:hypothetical protein
MFLGHSKGIGLRVRGKDDLHVCFLILTEDDESWFASHNSFSSHWAPELIAQLQAAVSWCEAHCEPDINNGIQYGWRFKS